jgi:hypothetical protein
MIAAGTTAVNGVKQMEVLFQKALKKYGRRLKNF